MFGMFTKCTSCIKQDVCKYREIYEEIFENYEKLTEELDKDILSKLSEIEDEPRWATNKFFSPKSELDCEKYVENTPLSY